MSFRSLKFHFFSSKSSGNNQLINAVIYSKITPFCIFFNSKFLIYYSFINFNKILILNFKKKKKKKTRNKLKKGYCIWRTITKNKIQSPPNIERLRGRERGERKRKRDREIERGKEGEERSRGGKREKT